MCQKSISWAVDSSFTKLLFNSGFNVLGAVNVFRGSRLDKESRHSTCRNRRTRLFLKVAWPSVLNVQYWLAELAWHFTKLVRASLTHTHTHLTCSKGVLVLMPLPPTKIQLSRNFRLVATELPSSEMSFLASSFSLTGGEENHTHTSVALLWQQEGCTT